MPTGNPARVRVLLLAGATLAFPTLTWQAGLPDDVILLGRIKLKMKQNLSRVPSYTCLETMDRGQRAPDRFVIAVPGKQVPYRRIDVVRLEVAELGDQELFAHAGEHNFEKSDILEFAKGGLIGNGMFVGLAHDLFVTFAPNFRFIGDESKDGRTLVRYDFTVPQFVSGYLFTTNLASAKLGYHGSFWADPKTFDAVRVDLAADDVPRSLGISEVEERINYARMRIGSRDVLLAESGEMRTRDLRGWDRHNQIAFTHCREYGVESSIRFDDVAESGASGTNYVELPSGLQLSLKLETPVDADTAHIGDLLRARVDTDARLKNAVIVPKGAVVSGRLRRLEVHTEGLPYVLAGLEFMQIEFAGKQARFFAELEKVTAARVRRVAERDLPGVGVVSAMGNHLRLPAGTEMIWRTISYKQAGAMAK